MKRVDLDTVDQAVQQFVRGLAVDPEGIELALRGEVVCKVILPLQLTETQKQSVIDKRRDLMRRARERNEGVTPKVIEREVRDAVDEVRGRKQS